MHIVHNLTLRQKDNEILGNKAHGLLLHLLRNPDTCVLSYTEHSTDNTNICSVQVTRTPYGIRIPRGNRHLREIARKFLGFGINIFDQLIDIFTRLHFQHLSAHILSHGNKLNQRIRIGDGLDIIERRHIIFYLHILAIPLQYIFFVTHNLSLIFFHFSFPFTFPFFQSVWKLCFGKVIILWPSAHGFNPQLMRGSGTMLANGANFSAVL